jgi:hypothetical protein
VPVIREKVGIGVEASSGQAHPPPGFALEPSEQVFLQDEGGVWNVLTSGSGIACSDTDLPPELEEACRALGLL